MRKEIEIVYVVIDFAAKKVVAVCATASGAIRARENAAHPVEIVKRTVRK